MNTLHIAHRAGLIKPSPTIAVTTKAAELRRAGKDVIGLGAGEPDFPTPDHIKAAAVAAIDDNQTRYTAVDGTPELKTAIIEKFKRDNNLDYAMDQVLASAGGKQCIYNLMMAVLDPGDECIIPAPYWVSYPDMCLLTEATPVIISASAENRFKITPEQLDQAITDKTRLLMLNSPSNPTGSVYSEHELAQLGEVLLKYPHVMVATDDIYEKILWANGPFANIVTACPALYDRSFVLNGVSKAYAMTGWRIGYIAGPSAVIKQAKKIQSQSTSNPCSISQAAAVAALSGTQEPVQQMLKVFERRHNAVVAGLNSLPGVHCQPADGAFYAFADFSEAMQSANIADDVDFAEYILEKAEVALVPGSAFGAPGFMRISFATSDELLERAIDRLHTLLAA